MFVKLANFGNDALTFAVTTNQNVEDESETFFFTHHGAMTQRGVNNALLFLCQYYDREKLIDVIRLLLDLNIDVNWMNSEGENALHFVCGDYGKDNLIGIIQLLLDRGIDGDNAIILLCALYQKANVIDIIDNQIEVDWKNNKGWNALHCACRFQPQTNLHSLVKLLIQNKIEANLLTTGGEIGTARSFFLGRFKEEEIKEVERSYSNVGFKYVGVIHGKSILNKQLFN
jgi:hypothetical protein